MTLHQCELSCDQFNIDKIITFAHFPVQCCKSIPSSRQIVNTTTILFSCREIKKIMRHNVTQITHCLMARDTKQRIQLPIIFREGLTISLTVYLFPNNDCNKRTGVALVCDPRSGSA